MHLSYEGGSHGGGVSRVRLLAPLRHRDFRLLWSGMCVSLLGDGIFLVAMAWQVYALSNAPTALAVVGITMTIPTIAFLLLGGVISDRLDRRRIMLAADVVRGLAVGLLALPSLPSVL
jgi:MFS family permease